MSCKRKIPLFQSVVDGDPNPISRCRMWLVLLHSSWFKQNLAERSIGCSPNNWVENFITVHLDRYKHRQFRELRWWQERHSRLEKNKPTMHLRFVIESKGPTEWCQVTITLFSCFTKIKMLSFVFFIRTKECLKISTTMKRNV